MSDTKPPVEPGDITLIDVSCPGAWVPAADAQTHQALADARAQLAAAGAEIDKVRAENKGWRGLFRRVEAALVGGKARKDDDFDSGFPG